MLNCEAFEFSLNRLSVGTWWLLMYCHETIRCYNSNKNYPICPKLLMFDKIPAWKNLHANIQLYSATYWQQEITYFIAWYTLPIGFNRSNSTVVRKASMMLYSEEWVFIELRWFDMKTETIETWICIIRSFPNFKCLIRVPAWRHLQANIKSPNFNKCIVSWIHLVKPGGDCCFQ